TRVLEGEAAMTVDPDDLDLPDAAIAVLDAVDERRLAPDAPEVAAWRTASPRFEDAITHLLFARELWAATRSRFELARAELPAVADHRCVSDAVAKLGGVRLAAPRRLPWAVLLAAAAVVFVALTTITSNAEGSPARETLGQEIRIEVLELGSDRDLVLRWTGPSLRPGEAFRVRMRSDGQVLDVVRVTTTEWAPDPAIEGAQDRSFQVQRLDAFRRVVQSSEWISVPDRRRE
ncbi:MAG: hypothetical protein AB7I19_01275, partial [Planctomycetota bacterium]